MKIIKIALVLITATLISHCATIAGDNTRQVKVDSVPKGAEIYIDNQRYGKTPSVVTLPSSIYGGKTILLKKRGYHEQALSVNTSFQPVAILDILFWPTFIVDGLTGSLVKIDPASRDLSAELDKA